MFDIVIPYFNNKATINKLLRSIKDQDLPGKIISDYESEELQTNIDRAETGCFQNWNVLENKSNIISTINFVMV